jgi:hypothetical protein
MPLWFKIAAMFVLAISSAKPESLKTTREYQTVQHPERRPLRRFPPQHVKLMTQNRVFSLKGDPRPERSDQRQPN